MLRSMLRSMLLIVLVSVLIEGFVVVSPGKPRLFRNNLAFSQSKSRTTIHHQTAKTTEIDSDPNPKYRLLFELNNEISRQNYSSAANLQKQFVATYGFTPVMGPMSLKNYTVAVAGANGRYILSVGTT